MEICVIAVLREISLTVGEIVALFAKRYCSIVVFIHTSRLKILKDTDGFKFN